MTMPGFSAASALGPRPIAAESFCSNLCLRLVEDCYNRCGDGLGCLVCDQRRDTCISICSVITTIIGSLAQ
jgi:hypothetical protein